MSREPERGRREGPSSALRFDRAEAPKGKDSPAPKWRKAATRKAKEQAPVKLAPGGRGAGSALPPSDLPTQAAAPTEGETVTRDSQPPQARGAVLREKGAKFKAGAAVTVQTAAKGREAPAPIPGPVTSGQSVPKSPYRQKSNAQSSDRLHQGKDGGALRQDPEAHQPSRDGGSGGQRAAAPAGPEGSKLRMEKSKLRMEKREGNLNRAKEKLSKQKPPKRPGLVKRAAVAAGWTAHGYIHSKLYEAEYENVGIEGAHRSELVGEAVARTAYHTTRRRIRSRPTRAVQKAERKYTRAKADFHFQQARLEHPELERRPLARLWKRRQIRAQQVKQAREAAKGGVTLTERAVEGVERLAASTVAFLQRHPGGVVLALCAALLIFSLQSCVSGLATIGNGMTGGVTATTYPAEDADLLGAEAAYVQLETDLQSLLDNYEATHDYDEYHFDLDEIEHDPYVLLSILSATREDTWTLAGVNGDLQDLFDRQYILTEDVTVETRYYTDTYTWTDEDGVEHEDDEEVPYDYYICTVALENTYLSHLPVYMMGEDQLSRYAHYMRSLGNRPDLFPTSGYISKYVTNSPTLHEVPESYLNDPSFAAIMAEATKYIGYPYVWGGHTPATSFDCSGFVCWVVNHCGWNIGQHGAQSLYNVCVRVSNPRPGDLVFFTGTMDGPGVTHTGIYVGDGWMLHCGDPIQYANLNSSYWQAHFYAYGRLP